MGERPDYVLQARTRGDKQYNARVGVAWVKLANDGTQYLSLQLNPGVRLSWDDELYLSLWPDPPVKRGGGEVAGGSNGK
jgi:uncharacterized protein (DUF736 family)